MSTIAERLTAALAAETGVAGTDILVTRDRCTGCWVTEAGGVRVRASRGQTKIWLDDAHETDDVVFSTRVENIRDSISSARTNVSTVQKAVERLTDSGRYAVRTVKTHHGWRILVTSTEIVNRYGLSCSLTISAHAGYLFVPYFLNGNSFADLDTGKRFRENVLECLGVNRTASGGVRVP